MKERPPSVVKHMIGGFVFAIPVAVLAGIFAALDEPKFGPAFLGHFLAVSALGGMIGLVGGYLLGEFRQGRYESTVGVGRCEQCAYDLTGNISGVCPECGKEICPEQPQSPAR